jgi:hypothetical protein
MLYLIFLSQFTIFSSAVFYFLIIAKTILIRRREPIGLSLLAVFIAIDFPRSIKIERLNHNYLIVIAVAFALYSGSQKSEVYPMPYAQSYLIFLRKAINLFLYLRLAIGTISSK